MFTAIVDIVEGKVIWMFTIQYGVTLVRALASQDEENEGNIRGKSPHFCKAACAVCQFRGNQHLLSVPLGIQCQFTDN